MRPGERRLRPRLVGLAGGLVALAWFFVLALARFNAGRATSYDLTIFSQAAQAWSRGDLPSATVRGERTLLADHFSPATAAFGLAWRAWPDPRVLLLVQAASLALAVGFVAAVVAARLGAGAAAWVVVTACFGRALIAGVLFDAHEVCLAVPLMAVLAWAVMERRLPAALLAGAGLVLVKEDLGLTVGMAGVVWWWLYGRGAWRQALALALLGAAGIVLAVLVIGHFNGGGSAYLDYFTGGSGGSLAEHSASPTQGLHLGRRLLPVLLLTAMAYVVGWGSPILALAAPTMAWRLLSSNASYWSMSFHYDLVLWPIAVLAAVDAVQRHGVTARAWLRPVVLLSGLAVMASGAIFVHAKAIDPRQAFWQVDRLRDLDRLVAGVPRGERVAAQNDLGPYLVSRYDVAMLGLGRTQPVRWLVLSDEDRLRFQAPACARRELLVRLAADPSVRLRRVGDLVLVDLGRPRPAPLRNCASGP